MAPSFDCVASSLLCAEDNSVFDDNEFNTLHHWDNHQRQQSFDGLQEGVPLLSEECLALMLERESQCLPCCDYLKRLSSGDLDLEARNEAILWIVKVNEHFGFGPLCAYLSINYLDRFLSAYELPEGGAWMMQLLAVACLSLAAKMEETEVPLSLDLQVGELKFLFEAKTIQRMELLVLSTLKWRMQAVTPFSFIDCFIRKINDDQLPPPRTSMMRSIQLVLDTAKGIDFLEFRPSEIAAAVATLALKENQTVDSEKAASVLSHYVQKASMMKCIELIHEMTLIAESVKGGNSSVSTVPRSPIRVLDVACLSSGSSGSSVGSCANSVNCSPETKRRKLNGPCEVEL